MEQMDTSAKFVEKVFKYMKNDMPVETFMDKFHITNSAELTGIVELCKLYGKDISIEVDATDTLVFRKNASKIPMVSKLGVDSSKLVHSQVCLVSDTHFGNIHQQLHLLNEIYQEAYNRGIQTVLHAGDLVDGNYPNRPENPRQQFLHGFDEQAGYVVDMYPKIDGMTTYYILGSHDETHYKNGQATMDQWIGRCRKDMVFLGQDVGEFYIDKVKTVIDHPGGGSAQSVSYKPQKRIEILAPHMKAKILVVGHYHKSYVFSYRNVFCILSPSFCATTQFQQKQGLSNDVGAYFLDVYSDQFGNVQYIEPEEVLFGKEDFWDEAGKDQQRVKQLVISKGKY